MRMIKTKAQSCALRIHWGEWVVRLLNARGSEHIRRFWTIQEKDVFCFKGPCKFSKLCAGENGWALRQFDWLIATGSLEIDFSHVGLSCNITSSSRPSWDKESVYWGKKLDHCGQTMVSTTTRTLEAIRYSTGSLSILDQLSLPHETKYVSVCPITQVTDLAR